MQGFLQVYPAYGRRYKTAEDMKADFLAGKDFSCSRHGGPYMSIRDFSAPSMVLFHGVIVTQLVPILQITILKSDVKEKA